AGQAPWAIVVTSAQSTVVPEHVFNAGLGAIYAVRTSGSVADPATIASIEYAAEHLGVPLCVVLVPRDGDELRALAAAGSATTGGARLLSRLRPAFERAAREGYESDALFARAAEESAHETVAECMRRSAVLRELVRLGQFDIVPALYSADDGTVTFLPRRAPPDASPDVRPAATGPRTALPPHVALAMLQAGHLRFLAGTNGRGDLSADRRRAEPRPYAVVLADADSRLPPEHVFDAGLGDLAVVRVAGCVLDEEVIGSIEHAVRGGIGLVVVLAPDRCGLIELVARRTEARPWTPSMDAAADWLMPSILEAQQEGARGDALVGAAVRCNVRRTVRELCTRSPYLHGLVERGELGVLGGVYRLADGEIEWLHEGRTGFGKRGTGSPAAAAVPPAPAAEPAPAADTPQAPERVVPPPGGAPVDADPPQRRSLVAMLCINIGVLALGGLAAFLFLRVGERPQT
ncbi:MAG TPA: carbonic anhydrase, partial [Planctomycetota bacterium]|nr:carbonic anhydrase [Planctomycetota bacterium]